MPAALPVRDLARNEGRSDFSSVSQSWVGDVEIWEPPTRTCGGSSWLAESVITEKEGWSICTIDHHEGFHGNRENWTRSGRLLADLHRRFDAKHSV